MHNSSHFRGNGTFSQSNSADSVDVSNDAACPASLTVSELEDLAAEPEINTQPYAEDLFSFQPPAAPLQSQSSLPFEGIAYKALNFSSFEPSSAVYRSVSLQSGGLSSPRIGLGLEVKNGLKTSSKSFMKEFEQVGAKDNKSFDIHVEVLLRSFSNYPVAYTHILTCLEPQELKCKLEQVFEENKIQFQHGGGLEYKCVGLYNMSQVSFCVQVSKLQSSCQKLHGGRYVVEIIKQHCMCLQSWKELTSIFVRHLSGNSQMNSHKSSQRFFTELVNHNSSLSRARENERRFALNKQQYSNALSEVLSSLCENQIDRVAVEFASIFAGLAETLEPSEELHDRDIDADVKVLIDLLIKSESNDLKRILCVLTQNMAKSGLLNRISEVLAEDLFKMLIRVVNMIHQEATLSGPIKMEAVKAVLALQPLVNPTDSTTRDIARKTLSVCAANGDICLKEAAVQALEAYKLLGMDL